jgi:hypothetical protein
MSAPTQFLNRLFTAGQSFVQAELRARIGSYIAEHRSELVEALETAQHERGRQWLLAFCAEFPLAAAIVTIAMNGTPEQAVVNVSQFDPELARELVTHMDSFKNLQRHWQSAGQSPGQKPAR